MICESFREEYKKFLRKESEKISNENFFCMLNQKSVDQVIKYLKGKKVVFSWSREELRYAKKFELTSIKNFEQTINPKN